MADLKDIRSDDPYVVREAALRLGRLGERTHVNALVSAFDPGGFAQFRLRPQENPARGKFGGYRDKVTGLAEALWMIGDPDGLQAAEQALSSTIRDGYLHSSMSAEAFPIEQQLLDRIRSGSPYIEQWRGRADDSWLEATQRALVARWDVDPYGMHQLRYWNGDLWTEHVSDGEVQSVDAVGSSDMSASIRGTTPSAPTFIVDVSNVVLWRSGSAAVAHLADFDLIVGELSRRWAGCDIRSIADASLRHRIAESEPGEAVRYEELLASGTIIQAPPRTKADTFVIREADHLGGYMVTNDLYDKEGEAEAAPSTVVEERFVRFHFSDGAVFLSTKGEVRPLPSSGATRQVTNAPSMTEGQVRTAGSAPAPPPSARRSGMDGLVDAVSGGMARIRYDYGRSLVNVRCANCGNYRLIWDDRRRRNRAVFSVTGTMIVLFGCFYAAGVDQDALGVMFPCLGTFLVLAVASAAFGIARWQPAGAICMQCHRHYESSEVDQLVGG